MPPRLKYSISLLLLMSGWFLSIAVAIWITPYTSFETEHHVRRDPRVHLYLGIAALSVLPSRMFLKATNAPNLSEMQTYGYILKGSMGMLAVTWLFVWLATTTRFGAHNAAQFFGHFNDLVHLRSRWNAGVTMVEGVLFLLLSCFALYRKPSRKTDEIV